MNLPASTLLYWIESDQPDRRGLNLQAKLDYADKRKIWPARYGHEYPDRRQHLDEIRPQRKIDKNNTVA